jgi:hypothetical protein
MPPMPPALDMRVHAHCRHTDTPRHTPTYTTEIQSAQAPVRSYRPAANWPGQQTSRTGEPWRRQLRRRPNHGEGRTSAKRGRLRRPREVEEEEEVEAAPTAERRRAGACGAHPLGRGRWKGAIGDDRAATGVENLCAPTRPMARLPPPRETQRCTRHRRIATVSSDRRASLGAPSAHLAPRSALRASLGRLKRSWARSGCRRMPAALAQAGKHRREEASPRSALRASLGRRAQPGGRRAESDGTMGRMAGCCARSNACGASAAGQASKRVHSSQGARRLTEFHRLSGRCTI